MNNDADLDHTWGKRCEALYRADLSALYHQKRERFFELADKLGKTVALVGGSAALWKIGDEKVVAALAVCITASSAMSLVFSFSERSKRHAELARNFRDISTDIVSQGDFAFDENDANVWMAKIYALEAREPPTLSALTVMCQNELAIARDARSSVHPQSFWTRIFAHFFDLPQTA